MQGFKIKKSEEVSIKKKFKDDYDDLFMMKNAGGEKWKKKIPLKIENFHNYPVNTLEIILLHHNKNWTIRPKGRN